VFAHLCKFVFNAKSPYRGLRVAIFRNCDLTSSFVTPLAYVLRNPSIVALDLSRNDFSEKCLLVLMDVLRERRGTPQYLLLHGNASLARHSPKAAASKLLEVLTDTTWGLSVSLGDFADVSPPEKKSRLSSAANASRRPLNVEYRDTARQPMRSLHFLTALNTKLIEAEAFASIHAVALESVPGVPKRQRPPTGRFNGISSVSCSALLRYDAFAVALHWIMAFYFMLSCVLRFVLRRSAMRCASRCVPCLSHCVALRFALSGVVFRPLCCVALHYAA
jgi:hypothetical protein